MLCFQYLCHLPRNTCLPTHAIHFIPVSPNPDEFSASRFETPAKLLGFESKLLTRTFPPVLDLTVPLKNDMAQMVDNVVAELRP